jgi:hypothetical protein
MGEPVYKQTMPYVPIEVKTHRDAYAATLHVLFKHIADFHICVVKTFSKKYGIPEDEIIQTIQESPEFKNMEVDPALHPVHTDPVHTDPVHTTAIESLGYKIDAITPHDTVPKKRIVKKKHTAAADTDVTITDPPPIPEQIQQHPDAHPVAKKRVVKKKQVPVVASETVAVAVAVASETVAVAVASETVARERESDQAPLLSQTDPNVTVFSEKKKVIKKTTAKNQAQAPLVAAPLVAAPLVAAPLVAAPLVDAPLDDCVKPKIIKKLKTT